MSSATADVDYYSTKKPPLIERISGATGQSNFRLLLMGVEAAPDMTEPMAALGISRSRGATPEVLEAHVARSEIYKLPLMSIAFVAACKAFGPPEKDWPWVQGAVADAFLLMRDRRCKPLAVRAKQYRVKTEAYAAMRNFASRFYDELMGVATREFTRAMRSESRSPDIRQFVNGLDGCYRTPPAPLPGDARGSVGFRSLMLKIVGTVDRMGLDIRNDRPGPVLYLQGSAAAEHCRRYPSQTNKVAT